MPITPVIQEAEMRGLWFKASLPQQKTKKQKNKKMPQKPTKNLSQKTQVGHVAIIPATKEAEVEGSC
jgi:hypothetical protein